MSDEAARALAADEVLDRLVEEACRGDGTSAAARRAGKLIGKHLSVALDPENRELMEAVARALVPHPKAMAAVLQEVRALRAAPWVAGKPTRAERMLAEALRAAREDGR